MGRVTFLGVLTGCDHFYTDISAARPFVPLILWEMEVFDEWL